MDKKPMWLQILTTTTNLFSIGAVVIGVSTVIAAIYTVWHALTFKEQIIVAVAGSFFMIAVILFIYGQTRKKLYVIPNLLNTMHSIAHNYALGINFITDLKEEDIFNACRVIDIDLPNMASVTTLEELRSAMETYYSQSKDRKRPDEDTEEFCNYLMKKSGLSKQLEQDGDYMKVLGKVKQLKLTIPSEDIMEAVNKFIKTSNFANSLLPLFQTVETAEKDLSKIMTPKMEALLIGISDNINDEVVASLPKVRESIERYYGKLK